jgi:cytochrome c553
MTSRLRIVKLSLFSLSAFVLAACDFATPPPGLARGEELFETCQPCHGSEAQGNPDIAAPAIAGLPQWYIEAQLHGFQEGFRGDHPDDLPGLRMRPMSLSLNREGDVTSVAQYVASLSPTYPVGTLNGNAGAGAAYYEVCVACHGVDGLGNELLQSPPIVQLNDWYLLSQLQNFKMGARGADPQDTWGATMRVNTLALNEQAMRDVIAYVQTLR